MTLMASEMAEQPAVLRALVDRADEVSAAVRRVAPADLAGVVLLGRGSSDNSAHFGRYLLEQRVGRPVSMAAPSILTRYHAPMDYRGYLLVAISQSGATPEIVTVAAAARERGAVVLAVTNDETGPLARAADLSLATEAGPERAVPATKTVTAQMLMLALVAGALAVEAPAVEAPAAQPAADGVAEAVRAVLADDLPAQQISQMLTQVDHFVVAGRGPAMAAAMEGALKVRETTGLVSDGVSVADLLHGPVRAIGPRTAVLTVDLGGPGAADLARLATRVAPSAAAVLRCAPTTDADLPLPAGLGETAGAIAATVRLQQVALHLALLTGLDPDAPTGLTKVTPTH